MRINKKVKETQSGIQTWSLLGYRAMINTKLKLSTIMALPQNTRPAACGKRQWTTVAEMLCEEWQTATTDPDVDPSQIGEVWGWTIHLHLPTFNVSVHQRTELKWTHLDANRAIFLCSSNLKHLHWLKIPHESNNIIIHQELSLYWNYGSVTCVTYWMLCLKVQ